MLKLILLPVTIPLRIYGAVLDKIELRAERAAQAVHEAVEEFEKNVAEVERNGGF